MEIAGRTFASGCQIKLETLAPYSTGPEIGPLVPQIHALCGQKNRGMLLRKPLVPIDDSDVILFKRELQSHLCALDESLLTYSSRIKVPSLAWSYRGESTANRRSVRVQAVG